MKSTVMSIISAMFIASSLFAPAKSEAYTIRVSCIDNFFQTTGRPIGNVDCKFFWDVGCDPLHAWGSWNAWLTYHGSWPIGPDPNIKLDEIEMPTFALGSRTGPDHTWIACANQTGSHRHGMSGDLYKFVFGGTWGPGYHVVVEIKSDDKFITIDEPLVRCP